MKKFMMIGLVAAMTATSVAATTVPAAAGGGHGHGHGWNQNWNNHGWNWNHNRHGWGNGWNAHVRWCSNRYFSYNPATNLYINSHGRWRQCRSPFI